MRAPGCSRRATANEDGQGGRRPRRHRALRPGRRGGRRGQAEGARARGREFLRATARSSASRLWVRINPLHGPHALADLAAMMPARPGGIMLPKAHGRCDVEELHHYLVGAGSRGGNASRSDQGDRAGHRDGRGHVHHWRLCGRAAAGRHDLGRGGPRGCRGRQRKPQPGWQLCASPTSWRAACACSALPPLAWLRSRPSTAISATKRAASACGARAPRRLPRHAGDPSRAGRGHQRRVHSERGRDGTRAGDRRLVRGESRRRRDRAATARCSTARTWRARRRCSTPRGVVT